MIWPIQTLFLAVLLGALSPSFGQDATPQTAADPWMNFVSGEWNKSLGVCLMGPEETSDYSKAWQDYRIMSSIRYDLLMDHWFKKGPPQQSSLEIDSSFQFQKLEPSMISGTTGAEKLASMEQAVLRAMKPEMPSATVEDFRKRFGLLKNDVSAYLQLFNRDKLMVAPYSGQEGFSVLYQRLWQQKLGGKGPWTVENHELTPSILKSVDAMARTLWSEGSKCKNASQGAYQAIARIMVDRAKLCDPMTDTSIELCSADGRLKSATNVEKVIAKGNSFATWQGGVFEAFSAGQKRSTDGYSKTFNKLTRENPALKTALCPTNSLKDEQLAELKEVYVLSLKAHLLPNWLEKNWVWPEKKLEGSKEKLTARENYLGSERKLKSKIKAVTQILDLGGGLTTAYDLKKNSNTQCQLTSLLQGP